MIYDGSENRFERLVRDLLASSGESGWLEFKENNSDPERIGKNISALANSAVLEGKPCGYIVWGVKDEDRTPVGTRFDPNTEKIGNEEIESWLVRKLKQQVYFRFSEGRFQGKRIVLLEIPRAKGRTVEFDGIAYIRIGSYTKKLRDAAADVESKLWSLLNEASFENDIAIAGITDEEVIKVLDYSAYFDLLDQSLPENRNGILSVLEADKLVRRNIAGGWDVTNGCAVLLAKNLYDFPALRRKVLRIIQYKGTAKLNALVEREMSCGYASGFNDIIDYISVLSPAHEVFESPLRRTVSMFPDMAIRELVANMLVHQDFHITDTPLMVEIFEDRIEFTNPGSPLIDTQRFIDHPPRSRNEDTASLMRRFGICEERGSGIDKVVDLIEAFQLPAPLFEDGEEFTRVVLFAHKPLSAMDKTERVRACYWHACLRHHLRKPVNNASLRERFGIQKNNAAKVSRIVNEAIEEGYIAVANPEVGKKGRRYLPIWAVNKQEFQN